MGCSCYSSFYPEGRGGEAAHEKVAASKSISRVLDSFRVLMSFGPFCSSKKLYSFLTEANTLRVV